MVWGDLWGLEGSLGGIWGIPEGFLGGSKGGRPCVLGRPWELLEVTHGDCTLSSRLEMHQYIQRGGFQPTYMTRAVER